MSSLRKVDPSIITQNGGKFIRATDGRIVEYSIHGNLTDSNAPVIVNPYCAEYLILRDQQKQQQHKKHQRKVASIVDYDTVNYKLISVSLPGIGHSDFHPGHSIIDWPVTDLLPILEQENVTNFHMCGASLGSQYAIATAQKLGHRVISLGIRVPLLPLHISQQCDLPNGQPTLPTSEELLQNTTKVKLLRCLFGVVTKIYTPNPSKLLMKLMKWGCFGKQQQGAARLYKNYPNEASYQANLVTYFTPDAMLHLVAKDVVLDNINVDPREVDTNTVPMNKRIVWYANDDSDCPPSHGEIIANKFWKGCHVRIFNEGYDHSGGAFIDQTKFYELLVDISKE